MQSIVNFVGGEFRTTRGGGVLDVFEPATGTIYAQAPDSTADDVAEAVATAEAAFPEWSQTPAEQRSKYLLRIAESIERNLEALARAESVDTGKPISLARAMDIPRAAANFRFFATAILHERSDLHAMDHSALNYTLRRARGVCGLISPWNLPLYLLTWKIAPALATGNTAVAKPSEITPMTAHLLAGICAECELPPGVLNIVHGRGPTAGQALVEHPRVPTISFTGGTKTGRGIAQATAGSFKKLALEMGGKNPTIIFEDADLHEALATSLRAAFSNQGQICLCGSRIYVQRQAYPAFLEAFVENARGLRIGDPLDESTQQGAVTSREHLDKVCYYVGLAQEEGGRVECGGRSPKPEELHGERAAERCANGWFYLPTVITGLPCDCRTNQEEIFGPVVTIQPFDEETEVVELANSTEYGLAASLWTRDLKRAHRVADKIASGTVWVNCWLLRDLRVPFGGMKNSGVGREGGDEALRFFTEPKNICIKL